MVKNIFDLKNLKDIPESLMPEIKVSTYKKPGCFFENNRSLIEIFNIKNPLTLNEVIVAMYRKYGVKRSRNATYAKLNYLMGKGYIRRIQPGTFEKIEKDAII